MVAQSGISLSPLNLNTKCFGGRYSESYSILLETLFFPINFASAIIWSWIFIQVTILWHQFSDLPSFCCNEKVRDLFVLMCLPNRVSALENFLFTKFTVWEKLYLLSFRLALSAVFIYREYICISICKSTLLPSLYLYGWWGDQVNFVQPLGRETSWIMEEKIFHSLNQSSNWNTGRREWG